MKKIDIDRLLELTIDLETNMKDIILKKIEIDKILENTHE